MNINVYFDASDEWWATWTKGHVDKSAFLKAALKEDDDAIDLGIGEEPTADHVTHSYMVCRPNPDEADDLYDTFWAKADEPGAFPVTALSPRF